MIGENIKRLRKEKHLTQQELGDILGVGKATISFYEKNKTEPNIATLIKLSQFLHVSVDELIENPYISRPQTTIQDVINSINNYAYYNNKEISDNKKELIMNILALMLED